MLKICILGSGSDGNAVYVNCDGHQMLFDCGFSKRETEKRLSTIGRSVKDIERVFITHAHKDHCAPWVTKEGLLPEWGCFRTMEYLFVAGDCLVKNFPLSHDSESGSVGYTIQDKDGNKVVIALDTGCIPEEALPCFFDANIILIECNYDISLLVEGKYSIEMQERIASNTGHLLNEDAADTVECVAWNSLKYVVGLHLSSSNNNPELVRFCLSNAVRDIPGCEVIVSSQKEPTKMITII